MAKAERASAGSHQSRAERCEAFLRTSRKERKEEEEVGFKG